MKNTTWLLQPSIALTAFIAILSVFIYMKRDFKATDILAAFDVAPDKKHAIVVEVGVELESFHMENFQSHGKMLKVDGNKVYLRGVSSENLDWFAHRPWINTISSWDAGK